MIRVACVGAGYWGKNLIRNFEGLGVLEAICDGSQEVLAEFSAQYPGVKCCSNLSEILDDDKIQAVSVATPAETHFKIVKQILLSGKHVYVEKPLCLDEKEAEECISLAKERDLTLMVGHLLWYHPMVLKIKEMIKQGDIGKLRYLYSNRLNMGLLRKEENVLWSFAPHDISMILGLVGESPSSVEAFGSGFLVEGNVDKAIGVLNFSGNVSAHVFVSWLHPFKEQKLVVVGDEAMLVFDDTQAWDEKLAVYDHAVEWDGAIPKAIKGEARYVKLPESEPLRNECEHFIESVTNSSKPRTDGDEGLRVLNVLNQLQRSMDS